MDREHLEDLYDLIDDQRKKINTLHIWYIILIQILIKNKKLI